MVEPPGGAEAGPPRFSMLETVREFGLAQLAARDETAAVRRAHADHFLALGERYALADFAPDGDRVLALLDGDHDNLRAALAWLDTTREHAAFLRLAVALGRFWSDRGYYQEGRAWLERALAHGGGAAADRARAAANLGMIEMYQGASREAETHLTEGLAGCRAQSDTFYTAMALVGLANLATSRGDRDLGMALLEEVLAVAPSASDRRLAEILAGAALINLAVVARAEGDHARAVAYLEEALARLRGAGHARLTMMALGDLGDLARDRGDFARAMVWYREALERVEGYLQSREVADLLEAIGIVAAAVGEAAHAARLLGAAEAFRDRMGLRMRAVENQAAQEQAVADARAALGEVAFAAAWATGRALPPEQAVAEALALSLAPAGPRRVPVTPREAEILPLLAAGRTDREIGAALFLSHRTVEHHVDRLCAKLGVRTRAEAIAAARAAGLVPGGAGGE